MDALYALDTNIYIAAFRAPDRLARLKQFLLRYGARVRFNAIVALELRAGATTAAHDAGVEELVAPYVERDRVIVPSSDSYIQAGRVLASLVARDRYTLAQRPQSFTNDVLVATSCREAGATLVTENVSDFAAIQRHLRGFRFTTLQ